MTDTDSTPVDEIRPTTAIASFANELAEREARVAASIRAKHEAVLRDRAVPLSLLDGWQSIPNIKGSKDWARKHKLDWEFRGCQAPRVSGLKINYHEYLDGSRPFRIRVDETSYVESGDIEGSHHGEQTIECPRYLVPDGTRVGPYFATGVWAIRNDVSEPIAIAEAPLKAEALSAVGIPSIGMGGVCAGVHDSQILADTREILAHPEIKRINWEGRTACIYFDAGLSTNPMVALGAARVWRVLSQLGATVYVVPIPFFRPHEADPENGLFHSETDQGPDDLIARSGIGSLLVLPCLAADPRARMRDAVAGRPAADRVVVCAELLKELYFRAALTELTQTERRLIAQASGKGTTAAALEEAVELFQEALAAKQAKAGASAYSVRAGQLHLGDQTLTNFSARIVAQSKRDDGETTTRHYVIEGTLADGGKLPEVEVPASTFSEMGWVADLWGARAIVAAGRGMASHAAVAIQTLSTPTEKAVFAHTGWRDVDGKMAFLLPGGAITADGRIDLDVELPGIRGYRCAAIPTNPKEAIEASLDLVHVARPETMLPLIGMTYAAPIARYMGGATYTMALVCQTGGYKSCLAALMMSHFGEFTYSTLPGTFFSSENAIEVQQSRTADVLFCVDNMTPPEEDADRRELLKKATRVIQTRGDGAGRATLRRDRSMREASAPKCSMLLTAELLQVSGESTLGRLLVIEGHKREDVHLDRLTTAQAKTAKLGEAMAGYLQFLAGYDGLADDVAREHERLRARLVGSGHSRTPNASAQLLVGLEFLGRYVETLGDDAVSMRVTQIQMAALRAVDTLSAAQPQAVHKSAVDLWLDGLRALLASSKVGLASSPSETLTPSPAAAGSRPVELVGWVSGSQVWLDPELAYAAVTTFLGKRWGFTNGELHRQLRRAQVEVEDVGAVAVIAEQDGRHLCPKRGTGNGRIRVLVLDRRVLGMALSASTADLSLN